MAARFLETDSWRHRARHRGRASSVRRKWEFDVGFVRPIDHRHGAFAEIGDDAPFSITDNRFLLIALDHYSAGANNVITARLIDCLLLVDYNASADSCSKHKDSKRRQGRCELLHIYSSHYASGICSIASAAPAPRARSTTIR